MARSSVAALAVAAAVAAPLHMGNAFGYRAVEGGRSGAATDTLFTLVGWAPATR